MTIEQAIKKAIEGGWRYNYDCECKIPRICDFHENKTEQSIFLDPQFWQSLGKTMGWGEKVCDKCGSGKYLRGFACFGGTEKEGYHAGSETAYQPNTMPPGWLYQWHKFIDHLADGKSIEDYFKTL